LQQLEGPDIADGHVNWYSPLEKRLAISYTIRQILTWPFISSISLENKNLHSHKTLLTCVHSCSIHNYQEQKTNVLSQVNFVYAVTLLSIEKVALPWPLPDHYTLYTCIEMLFCTAHYDKYNKNIFKSFKELVIKKDKKRQEIYPYLQFLVNCKSRLLCRRS
jgi:hypothetical protein